MSNAGMADGDGRLSWNAAMFASLSAFPAFLGRLWQANPAPGHMVRSCALPRHHVVCRLTTAPARPEQPLQGPGHVHAVCMASGAVTMMWPCHGR